MLVSGHSQVIVRAGDGISLGAVALLIQQVGGTLGRELPIINAQAAEVPNPSLLMLVDSPDVQRIALDRPILGALERTSPTIGATAERQELGYDGAGIGVAVIDSGVTSWHDDLTEAGIPNSQRVDHFVDFVNGRSTPYDDYGHGTHVAGIIAGNGSDTEGARSGIAPAARMVILKVLDGSGHGRISDVIAAFDYVINHQHLFNIRVLNLSIAAGVYESYNSDPFTLAAKRVVEQGIVVVAAAGNLGSGSQGTQYGGITAPGNAPWALMLQANPALTPNAIKAIVQYTAQTYPGYDALTQGAGFLNLRGAIELARFFTAPSTSWYPLAPEWSRQFIWGNHRIQGGYLTSDANAWSTDVVWGNASTPHGQNVVWGVVCSAADCETGGGAWSTWGTTCSDADCSAVVWGDENSENVVWGSTCGGTDCQGTSWSTSDSGTVQGSSMIEFETIVWGSTCEDSSCQPVIW